MGGIKERDKQKEEREKQKKGKDMLLYIGQKVAKRGNTDA